MEPSVSTIRAPNTGLDVKDLARLDRPSYRLHYARKVLMMNDIGSGPVLQFLTCLAEILQDLVVEKFHLTRWAHRMHEPGNVIGDRPKIGLALQKLLLGSLAIIDVCKEEIPGGYFVFRISQWEAADLEPSIHSVSTPATMFDFVDSTLFNGLTTSLHDARKSIRMNGISQGPVLQLLICLTEVLESLAVEKLNFTHWAHRRHQPRDVIDDLPPR